MNRILKQMFFYGLLIVLVVYIITQNSVDFTVIKHLSAFDLFVISALSIITFLISAATMKINLAYFGVKEKFYTLFHLSNTANLLNYLPLKAGIITTGAYLKSKYKLSINKFVFINIYNYFALTIICLCSLAYISFYININFLLKFINIRTIIICTIAAVFFFIFIKLIIKKQKVRKSKLATYLLIIADNHKIIKNKMTVNFLLFFIIILNLLLTTLRLYCYFYIFNYQISFIHALFISVIVNFSFIFSITPGGIGIKEGLVAFSTFMLFNNTEIGAVVAIADRAIMLVLTLMLGLYSLKKMKKLKKEAIVDF